MNGQLSTAEIRQEKLRLRRSLSPVELQTLSDAIADRLLALPEYKAAGTIECYVAMPDEVQTVRIIGEALRVGKRVIVPVVDRAQRMLTFSELKHPAIELRAGHFGILEPASEYVRPLPLESAQLVIVPVVAWDERGNRIGHGAGYYDRALAPLPKHCVSFGLAAEAQRAAAIPAEAYDVRLDAVVTERRVVRFWKGRRGR